MVDELIALAPDLPSGILTQVLRKCKIETKKYLSRKVVCTNLINWYVKVSKDTLFRCLNACK